MAWITLPTVFGPSPWLIVDLNADFAAIVAALNAFNPSGAAAGPSAAPTVRGLLGVNNTGTPNTKYDVSADLVVLRDPTTGAMMTKATTGTLTNDILLAGPAANGRDQAGVFTPVSWLHIYFIGNSTTLAVDTIMSATAPPTGPALPSGYTTWAYAGALRLNVTPVIVGTVLRGAQATYVFQQQVVSTNATPINTETAVSVAAFVPPNASSFLLTESIILTNGAGGGFELDTRVVAGSSMTILRSAVTIAVAASGSMQISLPNVGQQYLYLWDVDSNVGAALQETQHWVTGYRVPNGDA